MGRPVSAEERPAFDSAGEGLGADTRSLRCCTQKMLVAGEAPPCTFAGQLAGAAQLCKLAGAAHEDMTAVAVVLLLGRTGAGVEGLPSLVAPCCSSVVGPRPGRTRVVWMA